MASPELSRPELEARLWKELDEARFGMLGVTGGEAKHLQPMTLFADPEAGQVWFYSNKNSDLVRDIGSGNAAMLCVMATDQEFQACLQGQLVMDYDRAKIDEYWSSHVSAWFPEGKEDPGLTLLRFDPSDAQVWVSKRGPLNYGFQVAKANATHTLPDIGQSAELKL